MQAPVTLNGHNFNFTPSPSPSPTRRVARRSLSPIVTIKPSTLSHKRKRESHFKLHFESFVQPLTDTWCCPLVEPDTDSGFSHPKRIFHGSLLAPASISLSQSHQTSLRSLDSLRQHTHRSVLLSAIPRHPPFRAVCSRAIGHDVIVSYLLVAACPSAVSTTAPLNTPEERRRAVPTR